MKVVALALLLAGATGVAGETQRALELKSKLTDLRSEMAELRRILEEDGKERRLQANPQITVAQLGLTTAAVGLVNARTAVAVTAAATAVAAGDAELSGALDSLWLLFCAFLVFFMHAGFAMLEAGSCRAKNASNVLMKNLLNVCVGSVAWYLIGYGLAYGGPMKDGMLENKFIGSENGMAAQGFLSGSEDGSIEPFEEPGQSKMLVWFFQWAFCQAAATIVSGGVAERVKSATYAAYAFVMAAFIYPVIVAWTWGYGFLASGANMEVGFMDFAGSGVVHLTGGVSALAGAVVLGARRGRWEKPEDFEAHSLPLVVLGTLCLWFGWFGFNCGSTLQMHTASKGALAAQVAMNTTLSAATGGLTVFLLRFLITKRYDVCGLCNGILAGLVSITAGCGNMDSGFAILTGLIGGIVMQGSSMLQQKLKIDDPVDASSVHGACGMWGLLAASFFDWGQSYNTYHGWSGFDCMADADGNCLKGIGGQAIGAQFAMIGMIIVWAGGLSTITFFALRMTGLLRVDEGTEDMGMDAAHHSPSKAYSADMSSPSPRVSQTETGQGAQI